MGNILCATRGGEASRRTQDEAIALAKERDDKLIFLYVIDLSFLNQTAAPLVVDIESQLEKMGRFQLAMACEAAEAAGVQARLVVRQGRLRAELVAATKEAEADLIVLGRPENEGAVFDTAALEIFAAVLEAETGAEVRIL